MTPWTVAYHFLLLGIFQTQVPNWFCPIADRCFIIWDTRADLWLWGSQQIVENSKRHKNTRLLYLFPGKAGGKSRHSSWNWTRNNELVQNREGNAMLCYAKSLQSCLTLCDPLDGSPPGFPVPGILQAITLEWVAISFSNTSRLYIVIQVIWLMCRVLHGK